jgi:hypothetical protein
VGGGGGGGGRGRRGAGPPPKRTIGRPGCAANRWFRWQCRCVLVLLSLLVEGGTRAGV